MSIDNVIATRTLTLLNPAGDSHIVRICIGAPSQDASLGGDWVCDLDVEGLSGQWPKRLYGVDSVQSLVHALAIVSVMLDSHVRDSGATFDWLESGSHGFPQIGKLKEPEV